MKIAIVHDYLREYGGAERVVEVMHEMWPEAPLYTSFVDWAALGKHADRFKNWDIRTSWVQGNWLVKKFHSPLRFLAPRIWSSFDLSGYDVVISSSGWYMCRGVALGQDEASSAIAALRGVPFAAHPSDPSTTSPSNPPREDVTVLEKTPPAAAGALSVPLHICYIHHPPRSLYGYATGSSLQKYWPVRVYATIINFFLRQYDYKSAQAVDYFVANSQETARRVDKFYRRKSTVIYPPVETKGGRANFNDGYYLSVGRLTYSKRIDLAISACNKLQLPLKVVGQGKEEAYLRSISGPTVEFVGGVDDDKLHKLYAGARALIFCALDEDFGMVPVEAMAHGVPVVALAQGGVKETVVDGVTGVLFPEPTPESLAAAIVKLGSKLNNPAGSAAVVRQAQKFGKDRFKRELCRFVDLAIRSKIRAG